MARIKIADSGHPKVRAPYVRNDHGCWQKRTPCPKPQPQLCPKPETSNRTGASLSGRNHHPLCFSYKKGQRLGSSVLRLSQKRTMHNRDQCRSGNSVKDSNATDGNSQQDPKLHANH